MSNLTLIKGVIEDFSKSFGSVPKASAYAPGRVNLLGEHTDYNGGYVLPMPLSLGTAVAIDFGGEPGTLVASSTSFEGVETRQLDDAPNGSWTDYVLGSIMVVLDGKTPDAGIRVSISTDLPVGSGLSSSAALEVATIRALTTLLGLELSPTEIALLARRAENEFVGVPCGIMDQFSVSVGDPGKAVFLDTRKMESKIAPLPDTHNFIVVHSGVGHKLSDDGYIQRVAECTAACQNLNVALLSDLGLDDMDKIDASPAPLDGRARHIITENARVLQAVDCLTNGDTSAFAQLMIDSHNSQSKDYGVSVPEVDALVAGALDAGAEGARLTGGGFGGSIVALVAKDHVADWCKTIAGAFPSARILAIT